MAKISNDTYRKVEGKVLVVQNADESLINILLVTNLLPSADYNVLFDICANGDFRNPVYRFDEQQIESLANGKVVGWCEKYFRLVNVEDIIINK